MSNTKAPEGEPRLASGGRFTVVSKGTKMTDEPITTIAQAIEEAAKVSEMQIDRANYDNSCDEGQQYGFGYEQACDDISKAIRQLASRIQPAQSPAGVVEVRARELLRRYGLHRNPATATQALGAISAALAQQSALLDALENAGAIDALERLLRQTLEAIETGRSEPLFIVRDALRNYLVDRAARDAAVGRG